MKIQANKITISKAEWAHIGKEAGWDDNPTTDSSSFQDFSYQTKPSGQVPIGKDRSKTKDSTKKNQIPIEKDRSKTKDSSKNRNFSYLIKQAFPPEQLNTREKALKFCEKGVNNPEFIVTKLVDIIKKKVENISPQGKENLLKACINFMAFDELVLVSENARTLFKERTTQWFDKNKSRL